MKTAAKYLLVAALAAAASHLFSAPTVSRSGDEWSVSAAVPTCKANQNLEVVFPATPNGRVTIECNDMPEASLPTKFDN